LHVTIDNIIIWLAVHPIGINILRIAVTPFKIALSIEVIQTNENRSRANETSDDLLLGGVLDAHKIFTVGSTVIAGLKPVLFYRNQFQVTGRVTRLIGRDSPS